MHDTSAHVFVVDDDESVRLALKSLIRSSGFRVETYASAQQFLDSPLPNVPSCLVLDVKLPGLNGLDLQTRLAAVNRRLPIVFITAHADIPTSVRAMKAGAVEFLTKPFRDEDLLHAIEEALARSTRQLRQEQAVADLYHRHTSLTPREKEVMELVVTGLPNKQIAAKLNISEITVKVHRAQVMQKMRADSLPDLVKMSERLKTDAKR